MNESHRDAEGHPTAPRVPVAAPAPSPRWIAPVALLLSLLAVAAAGWSLFKPAPHDADAKPAVFTAAAVDDPKAAACKAASLVATGVMRQSQVNLGPEPTA